MERLNLENIRIFPTDGVTSDFDNLFLSFSNGQFLSIQINRIDVHALALDLRALAERIDRLYINFIDQ